MYCRVGLIQKCQLCFTLYLCWRAGPSWKVKVHNLWNHRNSSESSDQAFFAVLHAYKILHTVISFGWNLLPRSSWYNLQSAVSSEASVTIASLYGVKFYNMVIFIRSYVHMILLLDRTACHTNPANTRTVYLFTNFISFLYLCLDYPSFLYCLGFWICTTIYSSSFPSTMHCSPFFPPLF
jgi:hypothetical protein